MSRDVLAAVIGFWFVMGVYAFMARRERRASSRRVAIDREEWRRALISSGVCTIVEVQPKPDRDDDWVLDATHPLSPLNPANDLD